MDKAQIGARINRLLTAYAGTKNDELSDKEINAEFAGVLSVSGESVRMWRKGETLPRLDKLEPLIAHLAKRKIQATPEHILFGLPLKGSTSLELRQRIAEEGAEYELLRLYRAASSIGQDRVLEMVRAIQMANPRPAHVVSLHSTKRGR